MRRAAAVAFVACVLGWPLHAGTVYVKRDATGTGDGSSWANAFTNLQPAIEAAAAAGGGQVWVASGVYKPDSRPNGGDEADSRTVHFSLRNGVAVYGGFPADAADGRADCDELADADPKTNRVVLSGDIGEADIDTDGDHVPDEPGGDSGDNAYHVFFHSQDIRLQRDAALTGVCITAGRATGTAYDHGGGGGMLNDTGASPMLVNCSFIRNYAFARGGGMANVSSSPTVSGCLFEWNRTACEGGAVHNGSASPTITGCVFRENEADEGGGLHCSGYSYPSIRNCVFSANLATDGAGSYNGGGAYGFANCAFQGNIATDRGGAMYNSTELVNCVLQGNWATEGGAIHISENASPQVRNSVIWDNENGELLGGHSLFSCCIVDVPDMSGWPSSVSNGDPLFADASDPDGPDDIWGTADDGLRLLPGSPGIDSGANGYAVPYSSLGDLTGSSRFQGGIVDLGPYELASAGAGMFRVAFRLRDDGSSLLATNGVTARVFEFEVDAGSESPLVAVQSAQHLLRWRSSLGEETFGLSLVVEDVAADQTWTATVVPARPNAAGVIFVKAGSSGDGSSWDAATSDLQGAIDACAFLGGGQVWVAAGAYKPDSRPNGGDEADPRTMHFSLRDGVAVHGGFPADATDGRADCDDPSDANPDVNRVVLSGDIGVADTDTNGDGVPDEPGGDSGDNVYNVFYHPELAGLQPEAELHGAWIVAGCASGYGEGQGSGGGGMCNRSSSPSLSRCVFRSNSSGGKGGGIHNYRSSPSISNCVLAENQAASSGGGMYNSKSSPSVSSCVFAENQADSYGGGMHNLTSSPSVSSCVFAENQAASSGGGMCNSNSSPSVSNCAFRGNLAPKSGGAVYNSYSSPFLSNCLLVGNRASAGGAMWFGSYSSPTVSNSIFRDNGDGIEGGDGSGFTCNLIDLPDLSGWPASNSNAAPMFADMMNPAGLDDIWGTADDGLRLLPGSPGIDAGDDTAVPAGVGTDLVGNPRVQGVAVDLGPYEYCPAATGVFRVAFRLADDGSSALSSGGDMARVLEFEVASGGMCPEISVVPAPGLLFVRWVSTLGEESLADPLVLVPVEAAQTWAAIVAPARPNADGTVFVKAGGLGDGSSWAAATGDLQDAVEACALNGGGEVWVAGGVYRPDSRPNGGAEADARTVHFSLRNGVAVRGGFPADATDGRADCDEVGDADSRVNRVVLSGDIGNADTDTDGDSVPDDPGGDSGDNAYHVLYHPEPAALRPHAAMHGVWIVAGFAGDGDEDHQDGGGMYNGISSPTLSDCVFTGNRATDGGGMYNYRSSPSLANCLYQANLATDSGGGMHNSDWSWPSLSDCVFHGNVADLRGGGIYKSSYSLLNCVFMANRAREGGGAYSRGSSSFSNCAFQGNYGDYGGAIHSWDAPLLLSNCVFQGNRATYRGGAIYAPDAVFEPSSYLTVSNSVFRDNGDEIICSDVTGDRSGFSHNLIDLPDLSGWPSSNSNADPLFADEADPDGRDNIWGTADDGLHLLPGSPGIDAGDDTDVPASLDVDLLGNQRIQGEAVDQGPYEYRPAGTDSFRVAFRLADDGSSALASGDARGRVLEFEVHAGGACPGVSVETAPGQHFLHWVSALGTESLDGTLLIDAVAADQTWTAIVAPARPNADGTAFVKAGGLGDGSSWGAAMGDLQAAIEACALNGGGEVWVAAGVYWPGSRPNGGDESDPRTVHFSLRNGVVVRGGFPADASDGRADSDEASDAAPGANRVVLSGDIGVADTDTDGDGVPDDPGGDSGDNTHHVFRHPGWARLERSASLCGVSVVAGLADGPEADHRRGGGMRNDFSSPSISHCVFAMNRSSSSAGGMLNLGSSPAVSNCVFTGNQATSSGGGTLNVDGEPSFSNCVFVENEGSKGGGMYCYMISFPTLSGCVFLRNRASEGGGMYCYEKYYGSLPVLSNSIFWDNGDGIVGGDKSKFTHNLLDVADLSDWPASNSNADPQFADVSDPDGPDDIWGTADDGLRLLLGSPGIDAGDNAAVPPGLDTDLAGNARIQGGTVDLGPYECLVPAGGALPSVPAGPGIADGAVSVPETERLSWAAASFATEYAVYLWVPGAPGRADLTRPPGALPVGRTVACSYAPQTGLEHSTAYAWQVVARNANGETEGPVWTFTTWSEPPETPADGVPADGDLAVLWTQRQFGWSSCERAVSYNVYLWQAGGNRPGTAAATVAESRWLLGAERVGESTLVPEMGYCWQVIARSADSEREGPVWSFRTEANAPATFGVVGEYDGVAEAFAVVCSNWHDPEGAGEELRYEWRRNGVPVPGLDQPDVSLAEVAGQRGDAGLVSCRVTAWDGWEEGQVTEWGWAFYEFEPGWNVVALPLVVENADPAVLFTDPVARGPLFQGPTWDWNGDTLRYEVAETLEFGRGYWVFVPERREAATSVVSGVVPEAAAFAIQNRWRLVGFPSFLRDTLAEEIQTETGAAGLQEWRANGYHVSSGVLDFLRGYWIFLNQAAVLQPAAR